MKRQCKHEWTMPHNDVKRCGKCGVQESSGMPDAFQAGFIKRQLGTRTPANQALHAAIKSAKTAGRKRVNSTPIEQGGVKYDSGTEARFLSHVRLGLIDDFHSSAWVREKPVFQLASDVKYTADFLIDNCVVEVKSEGRHNKRTGKPRAYWANEAARVRFKVARAQNPHYEFQVWAWDKQTAQFVKVEG